MQLHVIEPECLDNLNEPWTNCIQGRRMRMEWFIEIVFIRTYRTYYILWATNLWQLLCSNGSSTAHHHHLKHINYCRVFSPPTHNHSLCLFLALPLLTPTVNFANDHTWATWWPLYFMVMIMSPFMFYVLLMLLLPLENHLVSTAAQMWLFSSLYLTNLASHITYTHNRNYIQMLDDQSVPSRGSMRIFTVYTISFCWANPPRWYRPHGIWKLYIWKRLHFCPLKCSNALENKSSTSRKWFRNISLPCPIG